MENATCLVFQSFVNLPEFESLEGDAVVFQDLGQSSRNSSLTKDLESFVGLNKRAWDRGHQQRDEKSKREHVGHHWCMGRAMSSSESLDIQSWGEVGSLARKESSFRLQGVCFESGNEREPTTDS